MENIVNYVVELLNQQQNREGAEVIHLKSVRLCKTRGLLMSSLLRQIGRVAHRSSGYRMDWMIMSQQYRLFGTPIQGGTRPKIVELQENDSIWWCACGYSEDQPYCDGSHERENTGIEPIEFIASETKKYAFCTCKLSKKAPLCDGIYIY